MFSLSVKNKNVVEDEDLHFNNKIIARIID